MENAIKTKKAKVLKLFIFTFLFFISISSNGQSREYIRNAISEWGKCRNVAITKTNGDLALYGSNGYASIGLPYSLSTAIDELREEKVLIDDVQLTENGSWLILYGNNGFRWNNIPYSLEQKIRQFNDDNEIVYSVTFNDAGDWIVISKDYYSSSDTRINAWLKEGNEKYGQLWAACITDDALVAVYSGGYRFLGEVPYSLKKALEETELDVFRLKIAGNSWFFADKNSNYRYSM